jgi:hypothetical protein
VAVAVHPDAVTRGGNLSREFWVPFDLLADQEERGPGACGVECAEHGRRTLRVGAVVERERHDPVAVREAPGNAKCPAE